MPALYHFSNFVSNDFKQQFLKFDPVDSVKFAERNLHCRVICVISPQSYNF